MDAEVVAKLCEVLRSVVDFGVDTGDLRAQILLGGLLVLAHRDGGPVLCGSDAEGGVLRQLCHLLGRERENNLIEACHREATLAGADKHAAVGGLLGLRGNGAVEQVLAIAQLVDGFQGDLCINFFRRHRDEWGVDGLQGALLGPIEGGLGLVHRQQRRRHEAQETNESSDDGGESQGLRCT